jgi:hypothetical protein
VARIHHDYASFNQLRESAFFFEPASSNNRARSGNPLLYDAASPHEAIAAMDGGDPELFI